MKEIDITINGMTVTVADGSTVAVAFNRAGISKFRESVSGHDRGPLCGMGICFECRVEIDGRPHQRACKRICQAGMEVKIA
jgi:predicted molibdopterin-dependent oxidoreductase YjgC